MNGAKIAKVLGGVFVLVGVLGFIPNPLVGDGALFHTNLLHDLVHLITGVAFIVVAGMGEAKSSLFMKVFGGVYLLVAVLGFMSHGGQETFDILGLIAANHADNILHVVLGVAILGLGFMTCKKGGDMSGMGGSGGAPMQGAADTTSQSADTNSSL